MIPRLADAFSLGQLRALHDALVAMAFGHDLLVLYLAGDEGLRAEAERYAHAEKIAYVRLAAKRRLEN